MYAKTGTESVIQSFYGFICNHEIDGGQSSEVLANCAQIKKTTLWPLFMDRVQLPQGYSHFDKAVYFLPLSFEIRPFALLATIYKIKHIKGMYGYK